MLTIAHRKQLHTGNVAKIKRTTPRDSSRGQLPAADSVPGPRDFSEHGSPSMQMLVYTMFFAFIVSVVCYFVFGGK